MVLSFGSRRQSNTIAQGQFPVDLSFFFRDGGGVCVSLFSHTQLLIYKITLYLSVDSFSQ